jgi:acyl-CoA reductase-like NAD-dependent aldehyde dehydrogenase
MTAPTTATIVWKPVTATETFKKMCVLATQTLNAGAINYYVSSNGSTWTQITALNAAQAVSFTGTSVYLKATITLNATIDIVAWGGI